MLQREGVCDMVVGYETHLKCISILQLNNPHKRKHRHCPNVILVYDWSIVISATLPFANIQQLLTDNPQIKTEI